MSRIGILALCLSILLTACSSGDAAPRNTGDINQDATPVADTSSNQPQATVTSSLAENVVATVNGDAISQTELDQAFTRYRASSSVTDTQALRSQVLDTLIEQVVINQAANEMGITVSDADVQSEIDDLRASASSEDEWQEFLSMNGYTEAEMVEAQRNSLTTQRVRNRLMEPYEGDVEQVRARHILVRTENAANIVLDRLEAGEGFTELAVEYSIDSTSSQSGGDLGWFTRDELTDEALADVAFSTPPNEIRGPVETSLGYHIIQTLDVDERPVEPSRMPVLAENVFNEWLSEQLQQATIERDL